MICIIFLSLFKCLTVQIMYSLRFPFSDVEYDNLPISLVPWYVSNIINEVDWGII